MSDDKFKPDTHNDMRRKVVKGGVGLATLASLPAGIIPNAFAQSTSTGSDSRPDRASDRICPGTINSVTGARLSTRHFPRILVENPRGTRFAPVRTGEYASRCREDRAEIF